MTDEAKSSPDHAADSASAKEPESKTASKSDLRPTASDSHGLGKGVHRRDGNDSRGEDGGDSPSFSPSDTTLFNLSSEDGQSHAAWLSDQLGGYSKWYYKNGVWYYFFGRAIQFSGTMTGLLATILAAAPKNLQDKQSLFHIDWHWAIAILTAVTTVLTGALGPILKLARDREDGRIEMVKLRQELDVLRTKPNLATFNACRVAIGRIATIERSYGGSKAGGT